MTETPQLMDAASPPPARGRMVEIGGGRRLHLVCAGPSATAPGAAGPTVVFEAGAFGASPDWAVVQVRVAEAGLRACAYDRAGLGLSDPGPEPRDSRAVAADLQALLTAAGEPGPYILVAHSMAAVHAVFFAASRPSEVAGLVLIDGTPPDAMTDPKIAGMVRNFETVAAFAPLAARLGLLRAADPFAGDPIGLSGQAALDKREAFASPRHNRWAAAEARDWLRDGEEAREAGPLSRETPVAVVTATPDGYLRAAMEAPARRSRRGYVEHVSGANHATLLGPRFADTVVRAILFVRRQSAGAAPFAPAAPVDPAAAGPSDQAAPQAEPKPARTPTAVLAPA